MLIGRPARGGLNPHAYYVIGLVGGGGAEGYAEQKYVTGPGHCTLDLTGKLLDQYQYQRFVASIDLFQGGGPTRNQD